MNNKKRGLFLLIILLVAAVLLIGVFSLVSNKTSHPLLFPRWEFTIDRYIGNFEEYKEYFETISNAAYSKYQNNPIGEYYSKGFAINKKDDDYSLYDYTFTPASKVELNEKETEALNKVAYAFNQGKDNYFDGILVNAERVIFLTSHSKYYLIYTVDESTPTYIVSPDGKSKKEIKKVSDHWFEAIILE